jgi:hypothetical protein
MKKLFIWFCTFIGWLYFGWSILGLFLIHFPFVFFLPWRLVLRIFPNNKTVDWAGNIMQEKIGDMVKFAFSLFGWW